jgi:hypothetical protein
MKKKHMCERGQKIKHKSVRLLFPQVEHNENSKADTSLLHVQPEILNHYEKTCSVVDQRNDNLLPIDYRSLKMLNGFYIVKKERGIDSCFRLYR